MNGRWAARLYALIGWLFVASVVLQVFLAGIGVFDRGAGFRAHVEFGYLFGWLTLGLLVTALGGRLGRQLIGYALVLLVLFALQSFFVALRGSAPVVAALHPLNGFLILLIALRAARRATRRARSSVPEQITLVEKIPSETGVPAR
jgi:hypothetical protein